MTTRSVADIAIRPVTSDEQGNEVADHPTARTATAAKPTPHATSTTTVPAAQRLAAPPAPAAGGHTGRAGSPARSERGATPPAARRVGGRSRRRRGRGRAAAAGPTRQPSHPTTACTTSGPTTTSPTAPTTSASAEKVRSSTRGHRHRVRRQARRCPASRAGSADGRQEADQPTPLGDVLALAGAAGALRAAGVADGGLDGARALRGSSPPRAGRSRRHRTARDGSAGGWEPGCSVRRTATWAHRWAGRRARRRPPSAGRGAARTARRDGSDRCHGRRGRAEATGVERRTGPRARPAGPAPTTGRDGPEPATTSSRVAAGLQSGG